MKRSLSLLPHHRMAAALRRRTPAQGKHLRPRCALNCCELYSVSCTIPLEAERHFVWVCVCTRTHSSAGKQCKQCMYRDHSYWQNKRILEEHRIRFSLSSGPSTPLCTFGTLMLHQAAWQHVGNIDILQTVLHGSCGATPIDIGSHSKFQGQGLVLLYLPLTCEPHPTSAVPVWCRQRRRRRCKRR